MISAPDRYTLRFTVQGALLDELGRVSTATHLRWIEQVARAHAEAVGVGAARMLAERAIVVVRQQTLVLHAPVYPGDDIEVSTHVVSATGLRAVRQNFVRCGGEVRVECRTLWVWIDPGTGRPKLPPPEFVARYRVS